MIRERKVEDWAAIYAAGWWRFFLTRWLLTVGLPVLFSWTAISYFGEFGLATPDWPQLGWMIAKGIAVGIPVAALISGWQWEGIRRGLQQRKS